MLKGVTQKQITVLYVLLLVLVVVLGVRYAVIPLLESNDEKNSKLSAKQDEYNTLLVESMQAAEYEELNKQLEADIGNLKSSFQSDLKTSNIDSVISGLISESGLSAVSLTVSPARDVTDHSLLQEDIQSDDQSSTDQTDGSADKSSVRSVTSAVTAKGSYAQLVEFIKLISKNESMYMKDLTFTMRVDDGKSEEITVNFSVVCFVYVPNAQEDNLAA